MNDLIVYNKYPDLEGIIPWGNFRGQHLFDAPPDCSIVFLCQDDAASFFEMHGENGRRYILVSAASDLGIAYQSEYPYWEDFIKTYKYLCENHFNHYNTASFQPHNFVDLPKCNFNHKYSVRTYNCTHYTFPTIPSNIVRWFQCNIHINNDDRIIGIPFGINDCASDAIIQAREWARTQKRRNTVYVNFDTQSNLVDREPLYKQFCAIQNSQVYIQTNRLNPIEFYREMAIFEWVVAPKGNGLDSYRIWEALSLGCKVLVQPGTLPKSLIEKLPVHEFNMYEFESDPEKYLDQCLYHIWHRNINLDLLTMSYWHRRFLDERAALQTR